MRIVRFECGCVGIEPDANGDAAILQPCDSIGIGAMDRHMADKTFEDVNDSWRERVWQAFAKAEKYDALKHILKSTIEEE